MGYGNERRALKSRNTNDSYVFLKCSTTLVKRENANENYLEIPSHPPVWLPRRKHEMTTVPLRTWGEAYPLLKWLSDPAVILDASVEVFQNTEHWAPGGPAVPLPCRCSKDPSPIFPDALVTTAMEQDGLSLWKDKQNSQILSWINQKKERKYKLIKLETMKEILEKIPMKPRKSQGYTLESHSPLHWKTWSNLTDFCVFTAYKNLKWGNKQSK